MQYCVNPIYYSQVNKSPNIQFLHKNFYKKIWIEHCEYAIISRQSDEPTQENGYVWKKNHPQSFGSTKIKL